MLDINHNIIPINNLLEISRFKNYICILKLLEKLIHPLLMELLLLINLIIKIVLKKLLIEIIIKAKIKNKITISGNNLSGLTNQPLTSLSNTFETVVEKSEIVVKSTK
jgi:hypothetical protein